MHQVYLTKTKLQMIEPFVFPHKLFPHDHFYSSDSSRQMQKQNVPFPLGKSMICDWLSTNISSAS